MIGIYVRVSTESQANEGFSLDIQKERGIAFARSKNESYTIFEDAGISGGTFEREQFQNLLTAIRDGEITGVWVISKDRLTRASLSEAIGLRDFFIEHETRLYIDGNLHSLNTPEDLLQSNILDSIAEFQRLLIKKKVTEARRKQIDAGENTYSSIYGYSFVIEHSGKKVWSIDPVEAELVRRVYDLYFQDFNFDEICQQLASEGYKTKLRGNFDRGTIHNILRRPEYVGLTPNTKNELIPSTTYTPIIDKKKWDKVQTTIDSKIRFRQGAHFRVASYDLSGILQCSTCGARFFFHSSAGRHGEPRTTYSHRKITPENIACPQVPAYFNRTIADYVMRVLFEQSFSSFDQIRLYMKKLEVGMKKTTQVIDTDIKRVMNNLADYDKQRKRLVDAIKKGTLTDDDVTDEMAALRKSILQQQTNLAELEKKKAIKQADSLEILGRLSEQIVYGFKDCKDSTKRREYYMKYCTSIKTDGYSLCVVFITGEKRKVDIRNIPDDIMDAMITLYYQDKHPEYIENRNPESLADAIFTTFPKEYRDGLAAEYESIKYKYFTIKTKGRPRRG